MEYLIAGLVVLDLAVTLVSGYFLRLDIQSQFATLRKETAAEATAALTREADTVKSLSGLWRETERQTAALQTLLGRADASETVKRLEALLENASDVLGQEDEARFSGSMEEGISNLLQYQVGKRREQS